MATTPPSAGFKLTVPLADSEYSNAFYTILSVNDMTMVFLRTAPIIGAEIEESNSQGVTPVKPVGTIIMAKSAVRALANQILAQLDKEGSKP